MDSSYASESDEEMNVDNEDDASIKSRPERVKNDQKSVESPNSKRNVILGDLEEELEKQLEEKAIRNELSEANVKSLLKAVLTHEDVRKYVEFATNRSDEQPEYHMKLTRAKAKQLIDRLPEIAPLLCVPCTPKKSDINLLLEEELLNDTDDDDEFIPTHETVEEDDESIFTQGDDSSVASLMSPPPAFSDRSVASSPALFDNISLRTRSKFSLSDTPLETLERAFVPPDVPKDLYDPVKGNPEWLNFLQGLVQPIDSRADSPEEVFHESDADENDDETDPEYNVVSDEELEAPDVDELRNDRTVQVSKKEVSELMAELAEFTQMLEEGYHSEEENGEADEAIEDLINAQPLHAFPEVQIPPNDPEDFLVEMENFPPVLSSQQILLIQQQLLQHIQLLLQSYLLSLGNPFVDAGCRKASKDRLVEIRDLGAASCGSVLSSPIMKDTFYVIESYERHVSAHEKYLWEWHRVALSSGKKAPHVPLHPYLMEICLKSCAFPYPLLLPKASFKPSTYARALSFSDAAHWLIASGLDDCVTNLKLNINITATLRVACDVIRSALLPDKTTDSILRHVLNRKKAASSNPIKNYFLGKGHPIVEHFVTGVNPELLYKKDALLFDNSWHFSLYSVRDQIKRHKSKEIESIVPPQ